MVAATAQSLKISQAEQPDSRFVAEVDELEQKGEITRQPTAHLLAAPILVERPADLPCVVGASDSVDRDLHIFLISLRSPVSTRRSRARCLQRERRDRAADALRTGGDLAVDVLQSAC